MFTSSWILVFSILVLSCLVKCSRSIDLCDNACQTTSQDVDICRNDSSLPNRTPIFLMALFPCNVPGFRGRALTVAAQMAAKAIRLRNTTLLQDYNLELVFDNTMCSRPVAVRAFINQLREGGIQRRFRHMIIGPGCSTGAITIAETAPFYQLTQISYTATSITLSDKRRFPTFLRTISSDNASVALLGAIVREFKWKQVAIITQTNEVFMNLTAVMIAYLTRENVRVITERLFIDPSPTKGLTRFDTIISQLNISGARVVLLNVFEDFGRQLFCSAYRRGMIFPQYLFISYYWWSTSWWTDPITTCTEQELTLAAERSIAIDYFPEPLPNERDTPTDVGLTYTEFWRDLRKNIEFLGYPANEALRQTGYVYDAVWAAAFALHKVDMQLKAGQLSGRNSLQNFSYSDTEINKLIFTAARTRVFRGVTGVVSINEFGDRNPTGQFYQYTFGDDVNASVSLPFALENNSALIYVNGYSLGTIFPGGIPRVALDLYINVGLFTVMTILSLTGIAFSIICIIFNIIFRKKHIVKLTSPYLNVVLIIGAIFFYVVVILFGIDEATASFSTVDGLCQAKIWISSIGFSLLFGPILVKAFRVYYIFRNAAFKKLPLKDTALLAMVAVMVILDVIFLIVVSMNMWRLRFNTTLIQREVGNIPLVIDRCTSTAASIWLPVLLAYKAIYLFLGLLLASQTFNVKIKKLRDSKLIVVSVFVILIISVVLTIVGFFVNDDPNVLYGLLGFFILTLVTGVLGLLFIPSMIELKRNPTGAVQIGSTVTNSVDILGTVDDAKIAQLRNTVDNLKRDIANRSPLARKMMSGSSNLSSFDKGSHDLSLETVMQNEHKSLEVPSQTTQIKNESNECSKESMM